MPERFISIKEVVKKIGISRTQVWFITKEGQFPQLVQISPKRKAYVESEIEAWMLEKIAARDLGKA